MGVVVGLTEDTKIGDLCLDYTLPGYPDYVLSSASDAKTVSTPQVDP